MGGLGKTRLSLQIAAEQIHDFPDGVWFLDLAPISDPALIVSEAAQVLGVREEPDRPLLQAVCAHLRNRRALLILDNCEHVIQASAQLASAILKAAPNVRMLASSREALHAPGEQCYPVLPLPVPRRDDSLEALARSTAVRLFVERAQQHKPTFALTEREAPAVAELVARLEGIPLALELAAARVRSLSVADINARLHDRYKLLTGGSRVLQERQQTLARSRRLVVRAAHARGADRARPARRVRRRLRSRRGRSGVRPRRRWPATTCSTCSVAGREVARDAGGTRRRRALSHARDDPRVRAREARAARRRRASGRSAALRPLLRAGQGGAQRAEGPEQADWLWRLEVELDNIRSAVALSLAGGVDPFIAVKFAVAMQGFWILRGYSSEGRKLLQAALALPAIQASPVAQGWALYVGAALAESQSDHAEARKMLETCLELRRGLGNEVDIAATLSTLSVARLQAGDAVAAAAGESEALQIFRRLDDRIGEAIGLLHLGQICLYQGDDATARVASGAMPGHRPRDRHQEVEGECELVLGEVAFEIGDAAQACLRFKRSLTVCREAGDKRGEANALRWLARVDLQAGDLASARARLSDALRAFRAFEMREELLGCLEDHAEVAEAEGKREIAVGLVAAAARSRERLCLDPFAAWRAALAGARRPVAARDDRRAVRQCVGRRAAMADRRGDLPGALRAAASGRRPESGDAGGRRDRARRGRRHINANVSASGTGANTPLAALAENPQLAPGTAKVAHPGEVSGGLA